MGEEKANEDGSAALVAVMVASLAILMAVYSLQGVAIHSVCGMFGLPTLGAPGWIGVMCAISVGTSKPGKRSESVVADAVKTFKSVPRGVAAILIAWGTAWVLSRILVVGGWL